MSVEGNGGSQEGSSWRVDPDPAYKKLIETNPADQPGDPKVGGQLLIPDPISEQEKRTLGDRTANMHMGSAAQMMGLSDQGPARSADLLNADVARELNGGPLSDEERLTVALEVADQRSADTHSPEEPNILPIRQQLSEDDIRQLASEAAHLVATNPLDRPGDPNKGGEVDLGGYVDAEPLAFVRSGVGEHLGSAAKAGGLGPEGLAYSAERLNIDAAQNVARATAVTSGLSESELNGIRLVAAEATADKRSDETGSPREPQFRVKPYPSGPDSTLPDS